MCKKVSKYISITSWNVNGLYRRSNGERLCKLDDDSVHTFMKSDIVCLSETHATKQDILKHEGYKCYTSCRPKETNKPSGGLAIFIRKVHVTVKVIDKSYPDLLWLKLDKSFFHFSRDLYICFLYISPINPCYTKKN
jgi:exonuclease III